MKDLSDFFKVVAQEKKRNNEEFKSLIGEDFFGDKFISNLVEASGISEQKNHKKKIKQEKKESLIEDISTDQISQIKEESLLERSLGLLAEPTDVKVKNDPLTPIDKKVESLEKQYKLFLSRIQQQLSTLGGGGEVNLAFMDMPITSVTSSSYFASLNDYYIGVNYSGAVSITLPYSDRDGKVFIVKDELGEASRGNNRHITIYPSGTDLIDGQDYAVLAYDYGSLTFVWKNNSWRVI